MTGPRKELYDWYAQRLRPKVVDAARSGTIAPARAAALERQMRDLLGLTRGNQGRDRGQP